MIEVAALCIGVGILYSYCSHNNKTKAQFLSSATSVKDLKGLGDLLGKKPSSRTVVVFGTVGSTSPVESNRTGAVGVFLEQTATVCIQRKNRIQNKKILMSCKEVPWYLEDGTARVNVMEVKYAEGFYDTLKMYPFTEPVYKLIERFPFFVKEVQILVHKCCEHVLEIGTPLTVLGTAERDKDGAPTIGSVYQVFNGRVNVEELVSKLESDSKYYGRFSVLFTTLGVAIGVRALHISSDITKNATIVAV